MIMEREDISSLPFMNSNLSLEERVEDLLRRLTLEEKFKLSSGRLMWYTKKIKRLGVDSFAMYDGPHGVRPDYKGENPCTYFPCAICRAATWDPELSEQFGVAIAEEVRNLGAHMILAPGINIQRSPMCGRTFEYQTEDPYLNKELAVAVVKGVQSQRIAACVKHFACNNQETNRFTVSSEVSERALQEIYLPAFKAVVEEADAWSFMSCYNKLNGIYGSEHFNLLRERLMKKWGFRGFVVSDWNATAYTSTEGCVNGGLSLEMPTRNVYKEKKMHQALEEEKFTLDYLDENIRRMLRVMFLVGLFDEKSTLPKGSRNTPEHQELARRIAQNGIILLKNENHLLPLNLSTIQKIAILGPNSELKTSLGGGSSTNFPPYEITPLEGLKEKCRNRIEIIDSPAKSDAAILFVGLNHEKYMDAEDTDKRSFSLPKDQIDLIKNTSKINKNTIVVLISGSPVSMIEWIENIPVVIEAWYAGMEGGRAIADVIFGDINPSGKLPITFPKKLSDSPAHKSEKTFPGEDKVFYDEGIFVGYRHFDTKKIEPLFPFGHGLSYTEFYYKNLTINKNKLMKNGVLDISMDLINSGKVKGSEVVQVYVNDPISSVERPLKELKRFQKSNLNPGEQSHLFFQLTPEDLAFFDEESHKWKIENGIFKLLIGSSSGDIRLETEFEYIDK
ncbi:MAG: glycosyl hydrolase [Promethearchaeota archaeon]|nr:MAG: glycosyl hydrolase [Candidatus Lokiarchaeota archaeon]